MLLRFDPMFTARYGPMTWIPSDSTISSNSSRLQAIAPAPSSLLFPPPADMDQTDAPTDTTAHIAAKPCLLAKRPAQLMAPFSEAAKSLLSSPLPPELVVDFKGSTSSPTGSPSALLRNSTSENNVHHMPAIDDDGNGGHGVASWSTPACRTLSDGARKSYARRKLESEDSSYDSDYECSDSQSLALNSVQVTTASSETHSSQHEDISRTVSDTLGAEFNEYVCLHPPFQKVCETGHDDSEDSDDCPAGTVSVTDSSSDASYSSRLEFALKLGYTEQQVHKALDKLGPQPTQNELLAELIHIASLAGPACGSTETMESQSDYSPVRSHRPLSMTSSDETALRHIVIDGSNVAISHGHKEIFSCRGIQLCVDWFRSRGHRDITVFVPMWRKETSKIDAPISNQEILLELEKERMLVFTPSRQVGGRRLVCYDDRFILQLAAETDGIVVSNDNYRDLVPENPEFRKIVEERVLMYSFVNDRFMPPEDPLGRNGPKLDRFLRKPPARGSQVQRDGPTAPPCPYGKKCTYGNKCKYYHPERGNVPQKTVSERLVEQAAHRNFAAGRKTGQQQRELTATCKTFSLPLSKDLPPSAAKPPNPVKKAPLTRTKSIVPSVSLLPPDLTEERPVRDQKTSDNLSDASNRTPILKSRSVENVARLSPVRVQQQVHAHSAMLHPPPSTAQPLPPPHSFTVPPPSMTTLDGFGGLSKSVHNRSWNRSGHVALSQQLSDPPPCMTNSANSATMVSDHPPVDPSNEPLPNPHRKVQRQLTLNPLNPACDPRIYTLKGLAPPYPPPPFAVHSLVTRNASAPAPTSQLHGRTQASVQPVGPTHMQRLNSTSDTQLNVYGAAAAAAGSHPDWNSGSLGGLTDPFDEWACSPPPPLPAPVQHSWAVRTSSLPAHQNLHLTSSSQVLNDSGSQTANQKKNEARSNLFYHLTALFPEEQVRQVMSIMPDETNAQKICAAILALYPKDN